MRYTSRMEPEFWRARWREGRIGFHEGKPNAHLAQHVGRLGAGRRVLVPLCGKAEDLAFLAASGHSVIGVELVEDAVRAFFADRGATPAVSRRGAFTAYEAGAITLLAGDVFATTRGLLGGVDALYDRAALIALPPELRDRYVRHLRALLPAGAPGLVITFEYDQAVMEGPPFSVTEAELRARYDGLAVALVGSVPATIPRLQELGAGAVERCFHVTF
jgi:thiopurine S-methyltransferase